MKSLFKIFAALLITVGFLNAQALEQSGQKDGYDIKLSSQKSLIVGTNALDIEISKDGAVLTDVKVKMKIFMPEMPGMPYMEYEDKAVLENGVYKVNINFSMSGTWQYHLKFKTKDDAVHTVKGSINL
ncbi:putative copper resistance protein [Arcobacter acticola]|uniref:Putative copper resistance protein n=1 Tax=Arcobacter acticola TaxID=1849015 RepID=A0A6M8EDM0_9BACT|nr:FixH family protein [Arcobacter acticola]QKE27376.1 putative copper resistance protein [Arcobacter acticola]